jgi:hypothetical protein
MKWPIMNSSLSGERLQNFTMTNQIAGTNFDDKSLGELIVRYPELFDSLLGEADLPATIERLQQELVTFVTQGVTGNKDYAKNWVGKEAQDTSDNIQGYWSMVSKI